MAIRGILVEGVWIESPNLVKGEFFSHFPNRFDKPVDSRLHIDAEFPNKFSFEQQTDLEINITRDEIKKAVWDCGVDKSPGPDGFSFDFFRRYWSLLENDVVEAVLYFFTYGKFSKGAFVANRQILDEPFILNELFQRCKKKKKQTMIFKVDFEKAYDSVRWDYLDDVLKKFGFGDKWCGWIHSCLYSSKGLVIVNGSPTKEFQFHRGLKQVQRVVDAGMFRGINIGPSLQLSHLFYADDAIFMGHWSDSNIDTIIYALECFYHASGLRINMNKSKLMGISVSSDKVEQAARKIGCPILNAPFSYLVPSRVLQKMEPVRCYFFNGADLNGKKQIWVKWNKVLASKDNGGLGIHGKDGKIGTQIKNMQPSVWLDIVREVNKCRNQGIDLLGFIHKKIGNGEDTLFWEDAWRCDNNFKSKYPRMYGFETNKHATVANKLSHGDISSSFRRVPRGGLEEFQYLQLLKDMKDVSLIDMKDRWSSSLDGA
ncbi:RNA-directed DNA polymerase, eukaryota, reverse transcriptase zinc-binding domain protein [Tanacetum coccineum]